MGYWACVFCGNPVEEHGIGSLCCGEVNHTEYIQDDDEDNAAFALAAVSLARADDEASGVDRLL